MKKSINEFQQIEQVKPVDARKFFAEENAEMVKMTLAPGQTIKKHSVDWKVAFIMTAGTLHFTENDIVHILVKDDIILSDKGVLHGFENKSDDIAEIFVIKTK